MILLAPLPVFRSICGSKIHTQERLIPEYCLGVPTKTYKALFYVASFKYVIAVFLRHVTLVILFEFSGNVVMIKDFLRSSKWVKFMRTPGFSIVRDLNYIKLIYHGVILISIVSRFMSEFEKS